MWNTDTKGRERRVAFAEGSYVETAVEEHSNKKLSAVMAMILGLIVTVEIMVAGAMMFKIDVRTVDSLTLIFTYAVVYFGVVAGLTNK